MKYNWFWKNALPQLQTLISLKSQNKLSTLHRQISCIEFGIDKAEMTREYFFVEVKLGVHLVVFNMT